jgi:hypothetical protein
MQLDNARRVPDAVERSARGSHFHTSDRVAGSSLVQAWATIATAAPADGARLALFVRLSGATPLRFRVRPSRKGSGGPLSGGRGLLACVAIRRVIATVAGGPVLSGPGSGRCGVVRGRSRPGGGYLVTVQLGEVVGHHD